MQGLATEAFWYVVHYLTSTIQIKVVTGTLNSQKYQDQILESGVRPPLDSLDGQNMVLRDDIPRPHFTPIIQEYKNQQNIASLPWPSLLSALTLLYMCGTSSTDMFEFWNQP